MEYVMNKRKSDFEKMLDRKIEQTRIEKARKEAQDIHNYNQWKQKHDKLVNKELKKLERKRRYPLILKIGFIIVLLLIIYNEVIKWYPEAQIWVQNLIHI